MIINNSKKPISTDKVECKCFKCGNIKQHVLKEHVRTVNRQSRLVLNYHCSDCFRNLPEYKQECSEKSKSVLHEITKGSSERSKALWLDQDYRNERLKDADKLKDNPEFAEKISKAIKKKFREDHEYYNKIKESRRNVAAEFFEKCAKVHDEYYDYSVSQYSNINEKIKIKCPIHGFFEQLPSNHVRGHGCSQCSLEQSKLTQEEFFNRCSSIHNGKYNYSDSFYTSSNENIVYRCPKHGAIEQLAQNHVRGVGCRLCDAEKTTSKGESEIAAYISNFGISERNNRTLLDGIELDIVFNKKIAIEYHGLYWHSYNRIETKQERFRHFNKLELARSKGLELLQVYENEWVYKQDIVKSMISAKLGFVCHRLYARKCDIKAIDEKQAEDFFNKNHISGHRSAATYCALIADGIIQCAASFSYLNRRYELIRFCNSMNTIVVGGLSRLLKHSNYNNIFTYVDRRYSTNAKSYVSCGFKVLGVTEPGYDYCKGTNVYSRQAFQKSKLKNKLVTYDENLTEAQNMFNNGYRRIWNAGNYKMELIR